MPFLAECIGMAFVEIALNKFLSVTERVETTFTSGIQINLAEEKKNKIQKCQEKQIPETVSKLYRESSPATMSRSSSFAIHIWPRDILFVI